MDYEFDAAEARPVGSEIWLPLKDTRIWAIEYGVLRMQGE